METDRGGAARAGRRPTTTQADIADVALELFATNGFSAVSVDDIAVAAGISRRTLFRYYPSKNAIPWGDFDAHLTSFDRMLEAAGPQTPVRAALRAALLDFNTFEAAEVARLRRRMQVILQTPELQAYSMTMYAGWRDVVAGFVARRTGAEPGDLAPQTIAWLMLGVALAAYEHWLADESAPLPQVLAEAFDTMAGGLG